jgi:hypothetical protein
LWVHDACAGEGVQLPLQIPVVAAHGNNYYTPSPRGVEAFSRSGVPVATLETDPNDGRIILMSVRISRLLHCNCPCIKLIFFAGQRSFSCLCYDQQLFVLVGREQVPYSCTRT